MNPSLSTERTERALVMSLLRIEMLDTLICYLRQKKWITLLTLCCLSDKCLSEGHISIMLPDKECVTEYCSLSGLARTILVRALYGHRLGRIRKLDALKGARCYSADLYFENHKTS